MEFESRMKGDKESWADFADELLLLASKAFLKLQEEVQEELSRYLDQIRDPQVSFVVKQRCLKSIRDAMSSTIKLEAYLLKSLREHVSVVTLKVKEDQDVMTVAAIQSTQKDLLVLCSSLYSVWNSCR